MPHFDLSQHAHASETIERSALASLHAHCPDDTREELGLFLEEVGDTLVAGASHDGSILLNRALGLGTRERADAARVEDVRAVYKRRGVSRYFMHVYPDTLEGYPGALEGAALERARGWMKFSRGDAPALVRDTELRVERVRDEAAAAHFGRIVAGGFGMTEAAGPLLAGMVQDPRWHLYLSRAGDEPAGAGALFVEGTSAFFEWGATDPAFRRRGSQGAVMTARIEAALELGCTQMFTETGEAVGDDPQHSYGNIVRYGFEPSILRENWAPPK